MCLYTELRTLTAGPASLRRYTLKKVVSGTQAYTAKGLTVKAHAFTQSAREAIEGNGGTCIVLPKTAPAAASGENAPATVVG